MLLEEAIKQLYTIVRDGKKIYLTSDELKKIRELDSQMEALNILEHFIIDNDLTEEEFEFLSNNKEFLLKLHYNIQEKLYNDAGEIERSCTKQLIDAYLTKHIM